MTTIRIFAPAKINLYLHVIKQLSSGYHALDSLVSFADIGDEVTLSPSRNFSFEIDGPLSFGLKDQQGENLVVRAARAMAHEYEKPLNVAINLTKNLPLGAGIGGGSSDAAAAIWGLCAHWDIERNDPKLQDIMITLGADVPVCFHGHNARVRGIGDVIVPAPDFADLAIVLVYPGKPCATPDVFRRFDVQSVKHYMFEEIAVPQEFENHTALIDFLKRCDNHLEAAALQIVPDIQNALLRLARYESCLLSRLSGSGSCCFGLFEDTDKAVLAAKQIADENPDWWVKSGVLGGTMRY